MIAELWKMDANLKDYEFYQHEYELFSFDIFDTLLFRTVKNPSDVFYHVGETASQRNLLRESVTPLQFMHLRILAQSQAKKKHKEEYRKEYNYRDIYKQISENLGELSEIQNIELDLERELTYINLSVYSLIKHLNRIGKRVILASDMYFSKKQIISILEANNFDLQLVDDIIVSSEVNRSKAEGELFDYILEKYKIDGSRIIHIGDHYYSDYRNPMTRNIRSVHYDLTKFDHYEAMIHEEIYNKHLLPELYKFRQWIGNLSGRPNKEDTAYFTFGAIILGPFFTLFTEWLLDLIKEKEIQNLYPFMSEAVFFEKLISNSCKHRSCKFNLKKMYLSRKSIYIAMLDEYNVQVVEELLSKRKEFSVSGILELLDLSFGDHPEIFDLLDKRVKSLNNHEYERLYLYLSSRKICEIVNRKIAEQKKLFYKYLTENFDLSHFCTLDFGYKGTIASHLEEFLKKHMIDYECKHIMAVSTNNAKHNIIKGMEFWSFYSSKDKNDFLERSIFDHCQIIESIINNDVRSTVSYRKNGDQIEPEFEDKYDSDENIRKKQIVQEGIFFFQELYLHTFKNKRRLIKKKYTQSDQLLDVINRVFVFPTYTEASKLGKFVFKNGFFDKSVYAFIPEQTFAAIQSADEFINRQFAINELYWINGAITLKEPYYLLGLYLNDIRHFNIKSNHYKALKILKKTLDQGVSEVCIYGAGEAGKTIGDLLNHFKIKVKYFVDSDASLHGMILNRTEIVSLDYALSKGANTFVIGSFAFIDQIESTIRSKASEKNKAINIIKY
jgi:predicted HAD superfamily hydrolase